MMSGFIFFGVVCIATLGMGRLFWRGIQTFRTALNFEAELRVHWKQIYLDGKAWDYLWPHRNWRKMINPEFLSRHPQLEAALSQHEKRTNHFGRELLFFVLIAPIAMFFVFLIVWVIEVTTQ